MRLRKTFMALACALAIFALSNTASAASIVGITSGLFSNPTGPVSMVTTGAGTSNFTWGTGYNSPPSSLSFSGTPVSTNYNTIFSFGTISYYNGVITSGSGATGVDLNVNLTLTTPIGVSQNFAYALSLINTINTTNPTASADYVVFPTTFPTSSFNVGGTDYTLEFFGFGIPTGSGFIQTNQFHVLESASASTELLGRITVAQQVPEPSTMLLLGSGIVGLGVVRRKLKI